MEAKINPGPIEEGAKVAGGVIEAMKREPISLALIVLNVLFLVVFYGLFREISASADRRDAILGDLAKSCVSSPQR